jgi:hypothetical protein
VNWQWKRGSFLDIKLDKWKNDEDDCATAIPKDKEKKDHGAPGHDEPEMDRSYFLADISGRSQRICETTMGGHQCHHI